MFSHVMVASSDIDRSKKFYDALFQAVGGKPGEQDAKGRLRYAHNGGVLMVSKPIDGKPATHSNGGTIGLSMATPEQAAAWHKAGVALRHHDRRSAGASGQHIWLISAIPTATSSARFVGRRLPELYLRRGRPVGRPFHCHRPMLVEQCEQSGLVIPSRRLAAFGGSIKPAALIPGSRYQECSDPPEQ